MLFGVLTLRLFCRAFFLSSLLVSFNISFFYLLTFHQVAFHIINYEKS